MTALALRKFEGVELSSWADGYRIRDVELAARLGFAQPEDIRKLLKRNAEELNRYGVLATVAETSGAAGGRPATVYYLNRQQSLLAAVLSRAPAAPDVREVLIRAFDASEIAVTDSVIFNRLFLAEPNHTQYLWTPKRLGPIARLYGVKYDGGRAPAETRRVQRIIYDLLLGHQHLTALRLKYPDPPGVNGEPYIYDHFHPTVRAEFEAQLDRTVLPLARRASSPRDFVDSLRHEYKGAFLQLVLAPQSLKGRR